MPTEAQIKAGNYAKKLLSFMGISISIENRKGSRRSGTSRDGKPWSVLMPCDYGDIKRSLGADGDPVDVFVGPNKESNFVVIVNQHDAIADHFDEVKVFVGFKSLSEVQRNYGRAYPGGDNLPRAYFKITSIERLKEWLKTGVTWGRFELGARINLIHFGSALRERIAIEHVKSPALGQHDVNMKMKGALVGQMRIENGQVGAVTIRDEFRGLGLGKKLYGEAIKAQPGRTLMSDSIRSDADNRVWASLAKRPGSYRFRSHSGIHQVTMKKFDAQPEEQPKRSRLLPFLAGAAVGGLALHAMRRKAAAPEFYKPQVVAAPVSTSPALSPVKDISLAPVVKAVAQVAAPLASSTLKPSKADLRVINSRPTTERGKLSQRRVLANHLHALRQADLAQRRAKPLKDQILKGQTHDTTKRYRETGLTGLAAIVKTHEFRQREPKEQEKPSALRRVMSVLAPAAVIGGALAYKHYNRPAVSTPAINPAQPAPRHGIEPHHPVGSMMEPRSTRWLTAAMKAGTAPINNKSIFHQDATPAQHAAVTVAPATIVPMPGAAPVKPKVAKASVSAPKKPKKVQTKMSAVLVRLVQFNDTNDAVGHLYGASDRLMTAYRKGRRVVPWIKRGTQAAEDTADIAQGRKVKDPFYKKGWFKSAAVGAAIAAPIFAARKLNSAHHQDKQFPNSLPTVHPVTGTIQEHALKIARKIDSRLKKPIFTGDRPFFAAKVEPTEFARKRDDEEPRRLAGPMTVGLAGAAALGSLGTYVGVKKLRSSLAPSIAKLPATLESMKSSSRSAADAVTSASASFRNSTEKISALAGSIQNSKGKTWLRRRLGFSSVQPAVMFEYDSRGTWDLRDARGKSARVFAPGSKRRERREKTPSERVENIRLVRNVALVGAAAGLAGTAFYRHKLQVAKGVPTDVSRAVALAGGAVDFLKEKKPMKAMSATVSAVEFARKGVASLDRLLDSTRKNVSAPDMPEAPAPVQIVLQNKTARSALIRAAGAASLVGGGLLAGHRLRRPKTGAVIGGLGAGILLS